MTFSTPFNSFYFFFMLQSYSSPSNSVQRTTSPSTYLSQITQALQKHPYYSTILSNLQSQSTSIQTFASSQKKIKPKMILKLMGWLQELCFGTFEFSLHTYQIAVKILLKYLSKVDEDFDQLQLIGCVSVHIASKLHQKHIIAIQCYVESSMHIFEKEAFQDKEIQIFQVLNHNVNFCSMERLINFFKLILPLSESEAQELRNHCWPLCRKEQFWRYSEDQMLLSFISLMKTNGEVPTKEELLNFLQASSSQKP